MLYASSKMLLRRGAGMASQRYYSTTLMKMLVNSTSTIAATATPGAIKKSTVNIPHHDVADANHESSKVPPEEYYHGHLIADQLEYLNDMIGKTNEMEQTMSDLQETYQKKREVIFKSAANNAAPITPDRANVGFMESSEIDRLFETSAKQNAMMSEQIAQLQTLLRSAKNTFAVDSPDGISDAMEQDSLRHVNAIIDHAALHEDKAQVDEVHNLQRQVLAVDAPDGTPDGFVKESLIEVEQIIRFAAKHEDQEKIEYQHMMQQEVRKDRVRDPEHDW